MFTPSEFMERVLPWPGPLGSGWGNLHWTADVQYHGKPHVQWNGAPFKTADELIQRAQSLAMNTVKAKDIYFCTTIQSQTRTVTSKKTGNSFAVADRSAENAIAAKAIWLDVDVKAPPKGYATLKLALAAINKFVTDADLPLPDALIMSGGGVHVYWISDKPLTIREWLPYAEGLKFEAQRLGLLADYGCTADAARVLRVPGTYNRKDPANPRAVRILALSPADTDFATALAGLHAIGAPKVTAPVTKEPPFDLSAFAGGMNPLLAVLNTAHDKLSDGIGKRSDLPLDPTLIIKNCPHYREAWNTGGAHHGQGLWNLTVLGTTWFENGRDFAHKFSKGYSTYTPEETDAMYDRKVAERGKGGTGLGWPTCKAFQNEGCKHCATCPLLPNDKSPLHIGERIKEAPPDPATQVVTNPITNVALTADDLMLPDGYSLQGGLICKAVNTETDLTAPPVYQYVPIFDGEVICKPRVSEKMNLFFRYRQGDNYSEINLPLVSLGSDNDLAKALLDAGIHVNIEADKFVRKFMRSWVSKIDTAYKRMLTAPLGWVYDGGQRVGFAYGGTLYHCDGSEEDSAIAETNFLKNVTPSGEVSFVMEAMEMLSAQHHPALEVMALQSWASPLLDVTGHKSTSILWGYSDSGSRKSSALMTGMAVWCAPAKTRERGGITETALENKMDMLRNLPAVLDEMTEYEEIEKVHSLFNRIHEGGQGSRATPKGGLRDAKFWQLILACGSNKSIYEFFDKKRVETDAKALRMFELFVDYRETSQDKTSAQILIGKLENNFGHLGQVYAKYLAMNVATLASRYERLARSVSAELALPGETEAPQRERFWLVSVVLTLMAAEIANEITGKPFFHYNEIKTCLYNQYRNNREWVMNHVSNIATGKENTTEVWAKVMGEWINNQIATDTMHPGGRGRSPVAIKVFSRPPESSGKGNPVYVHWLQTPPMVRVAYSALDEILGKLEHGKSMLERFEKLYGGTKTRMTFLAGLPVTEAKSKINVWEVPIHDSHPLYEAWADKVSAGTPVTEASAAAYAQDEQKNAVTAAVTEAVREVKGTPLAGALAQAAKDLATVRGAA